MRSVTADEEQKRQEQSSGFAEPASPPRGSRAGKGLLLLVLLAVLAFGAALYFGLTRERTQRQELADDVRANARTPVSVIHPQANTSQLTVSFPARSEEHTSEL